jgi:hypothetical protein
VVLEGEGREGDEEKIPAVNVGWQMMVRWVDMAGKREGTYLARTWLRWEVSLLGDGRV